MLKALGPIVAYLSSGASRRNVAILVRLLAVLTVMVVVYSASFHWIMDHEGRSYSWPTSVYWTIVTMSTLGFGDITFESDLGRIFSVVVLLSGSVFILILLPFTFIQFLYVPWMEARRVARAPRSLPDDTAGHIILTGLGPIEDALIRRAAQADVPYALLVGDLEEALTLHDRGYQVMVGDLDDPDTYRRARAAEAALVATTRTDTTNTNVAFTVRESSAEVLIVATASRAASVDVLELAGADRVLELGQMLGSALATRVLADASSHVIGEIGGLLIAEAAIGDTPLAGTSLRDARLRERTGVNVVGVWDRGSFSMADPEAPLPDAAVLVLAGSRTQLDAYDDLYSVSAPAEGAVIIIGGGRVGRAAGQALAEQGVAHRIVEERADRIRDPDLYVLGDAAELSALEAAGLQRSPAVLITTHDDDVNVYLTLYCRRLRPDVQIVARSNLDRNVSTLHRAGADFVLSYASTGATAVWNTLRSETALLLAEGLDVFRLPVPDSMASRSIAECDVRGRTGCNVVAVVHDGEVETNPDPHRALEGDDVLVLIGDLDAPDGFLECFGDARVLATDAPA